MNAGLFAAVERDSVTTTLRWVGDWPWYAGVGAAVLLGATAWLMYYRDTQSYKRWLRLLLPTLRALAVVLIVLMLSGPVLHHRKVVGQLARVIVCLDSSQSMQLTDSAMDAGRKISIARRLGLLNDAGGALDLPKAAEKLGDAKSIAASLATLQTPTDAVWKKMAAEFGSRVAEAETLFAKAGKDKDALTRLRGELAQPTKELVARKLAAVDDRTRAALELSRLADTAGRWSQDVSELFIRQLDSDPAAAPIKTALAKFDGMPRWERLQSLLLAGKPEQRVLARLAAEHDVEVVSLDNGAVKPLWKPGAEEASLPTTLPKPEGETTDLNSGLKFAVSDENKAEKGAVILLTDGQHNAGNAPLSSAKILAGRKMPVFAVGFGSQVAPRDIAVLRVVVPDAVFFEDRVRGEVLLKEEVPAGQPFTLTVKDGEKVVWEKKLVSGGRSTRRVPVEFSIKELAEARLKEQPQGYEVLGAALELKAIVSGLEGDVEPANNEAPMRFRAVTQKRRILILDGRPRWETRFLRNLFERDEKWEVNAVIAGSSSDLGFIRGEKPGNFPGEQKALESYELVIFGEVPRTMLRDDELKWLADFVGKRGGAMLLIDGAREVLRQYADSPLGPLLPVEWTGTSVRSGIKSLSLTERASNLGAFALSPDLAANADTWTHLAPPHWISGARPLAGAEVLLEADIGAQKIAAAVMRSFGSGRVYYQAFDDSWRWRYEVADLYHAKFWNQLADYVAEPPFAARDKFVSLDAGQLTYQPGEQADMRVRLRDGQGKPVADATINAVIYRDGQRAATISLTSDAGGLYRGKTAALEPGKYEVAVESAAVPEGQIKARTQFAVSLRENVERTLLSLNEDLLRQISITSGGEYFREEQCDELLARLAPMSNGAVTESDTVLWQSWGWFLLTVALLTVEWIVRKRAGML